MLSDRWVAMCHDLTPSAVPETHRFSCQRAIRLVCLLGHVARLSPCVSRGGAVVETIRKTLFTGDALQIGLFQARPLSDACGNVERQSSHAVVLPVSGLFAKHDAPGRHVIGTPSHAVLFAADVPYRVGFPGPIGDRALVLRFGEWQPISTAGAIAAMAPHPMVCSPRRP